MAFKNIDSFGGAGLAGGDYLIIGNAFAFSLLVSLIIIALPHEEAPHPRRWF